MTDVAVLAGFVAMCLLAQSHQQPSQVRVGTHADEAAHVITSLMVRDYAVSGFHLSPRAFAEQYYLAYPKVAFGIWPAQPCWLAVAGGVWCLRMAPIRQWMSSVTLDALVALL
jgi:hypothetical protein